MLVSIPCSCPLHGLDHDGVIRAFTYLFIGLIGIGRGNHISKSSRRATDASNDGMNFSLARKLFYEEMPKF